MSGNVGRLPIHSTSLREAEDPAAKSRIQAGMATYKRKPRGGINEGKASRSSAAKSNVRKWAGRMVNGIKLIPNCIMA